MARKSKTEELNTLLKDLEATGDIEASAIVSVDGLMIASALPQNVEEDRVAAMSAAMLSLGERTAGELARGGLSEVYVKGENGYVILENSRRECGINIPCTKRGQAWVSILRHEESCGRIGKSYLR